MALRIARDPRFKRLTCTHQGTYADDCIVERVTTAKCYIVATCDRDLKRRIRKIPGVPIMYIAGHRFTVERMPDAVGNLPRTSLRLSSINTIIDIFLWFFFSPPFFNVHLSGKE